MNEWCLHKVTEVIKYLSLKYVLSRTHFI